MKIQEYYLCLIYFFFRERDAESGIGLRALIIRIHINNSTKEINIFYDNI